MMAASYCWSRFSVGWHCKVLGMKMFEQRVRRRDEMNRYELEEDKSMVLSCTEQISWKKVSLLRYGMVGYIYIKEKLSQDQR